MRTFVITTDLLQVVAASKPLQLPEEVVRSTITINKLPSYRQSHGNFSVWRETVAYYVERDCMETSNALEIGFCV